MRACAPRRVTGREIYGGATEMLFAVVCGRGIDVNDTPVEKRDRSRLTNLSSPLLSFLAASLNLRPSPSPLSPRLWYFDTTGFL